MCSCSCLLWTISKQQNNSVPQKYKTCQHHFPLLALLTLRRQRSASRSWRSTSRSSRSSSLSPTLTHPHGDPTRRTSPRPKQSYDAEATTQKQRRKSSKTRQRRWPARPTRREDDGGRDKKDSDDTSSRRVRARELRQASVRARQLAKSTSFICLRVLSVFGCGASPTCQEGHLFGPVKVRPHFGPRIHAARPNHSGGESPAQPV